MGLQPEAVEQQLRWLQPAKRNALMKGAFAFKTLLFSFPSLVFPF